MKLYPYQREAVDHAVKMLFERRNSLIVAGTGAGKTIMMAATIGEFFKAFKAKHKRGPHILVLVHRTEIHRNIQMMRKQNLQIRFRNSMMQQ